MTEKLSNLPPQSYFDEQDALALLVPRAKVLAALADACGQPGAAVPLAKPVDIAINHYSEALAMHSPLAQPVLYVSPEQLAEHSDDGPEHGRYLPARKTPAGKFTQPLYAGAPSLQGRYPHLPQSVGDVTDFGDGKVDIDWGHPAPAGGTRLYSAEQMRSYVDADRAARAEQSAALAPQGERQWSCPTRTVADLVNNLLTMDQGLPVYGAQYIEKDGRRCAIAVPPTVSRERVKDGRWIGQGEELNAAVIWTRAEQPAAVAGTALDVTLDEDQAGLLRDMLGDHAEYPEAITVRLMVGDGHSGHGLYVAQAEYQDEGAVLLTSLPAPAAPALEAPAAPARIVADALTRLDAIYWEQAAADCDELPRRPDWLTTALHLAAAAPQASAGLDELRQIAAIAACWGCDHPDEPGDTEVVRRVKWAARQLRAVAQAPAAPVVWNFREEFIAWAEVAYRHEDEFSKRDFEICLKAWQFGGASALLAAQAAPAAPADPMDWPLPCDVTVGHGTIRKGRKLRTLVLRMQVLYDLSQKVELAAPAAPAVDAELLELAQAIIKFNREHGSILAVHIDNLADLVDERAAQAAAKGASDE